MSYDLEKEQEIKLINMIIEEAVFHGGDRGGAYFSNEKDLVKCMEKYLKETNLDNAFCVTISEHIPHFAKKDYDE